MKSIYSCCYNHHDSYSVLEGFIKSPLAIHYEVDDDYDFGSIHIRDLITDMYIKGVQQVAGIKQVLLEKL